MAVYIEFRQKKRVESIPYQIFSIIFKLHSRLINFIAMRKYFSVFLCSVIIGVKAQIHVSSLQQTPVSTPKKGFYAGGGLVLSSVNIYRNYRQNPYRLSFNARLCWDFSDNARLTGEYTYTPKFDIDPTWKRVSSHTADMNLNLLARIKDQQAMFYTITGLYYQMWKGFYTGLSDFSNSNDLFAPQQIQTSTAPGLNMGVGVERAFRYFQVFGEFRYRFAGKGTNFGITDASWNSGMKIQVNSPKKIMSKLNGKYNWF